MIANPESLRRTTAADIARAKLLGLQFFRIPVGFWIIEEIVDRKTEFYPRGGYLELRRLLKQTKDAGLWAQIELHALPGVSSPNQVNSSLTRASWPLLTVDYPGLCRELYSVGPLLSRRQLCPSFDSPRGLHCRFASR